MNFSGILPLIIYIVYGGDLSIPETPGQSPSPPLQNPLPGQSPLQSSGLMGEGMPSPTQSLGQGQMLNAFANPTFGGFMLAQTGEPSFNPSNIAPQLQNSLMQGGEAYGLMGGQGPSNMPLLGLTNHSSPDSLMGFALGDQQDIMGMGINNLAGFPNMDSNLSGFPNLNDSLLGFPNLDDNFSGPSRRPIIHRLNRNEDCTVRIDCKKAKNPMNMSMFDYSMEPQFKFSDRHRRHKSHEFKPVPNELIHEITRNPYLNEMQKKLAMQNLMNRWMNSERQRIGNLMHSEQDCYPRRLGKFQRRQGEFDSYKKRPRFESSNRDRCHDYLMDHQGQDEEEDEEDDDEYYTRRRNIGRRLEDDDEGESEQEEIERESEQEREREREWEEEDRNRYQRRSRPKKYYRDARDKKPQVYNCYKSADGKVHSPVSITWSGKGVPEIAASTGLPPAQPQPQFTLPITTAPIYIPQQITSPIPDVSPQAPQVPSTSQATNKATKSAAQKTPADLYMHTVNYLYTTSKYRNEAPHWALAMSCLKHGARLKSTTVDSSPESPKFKKFQECLKENPKSRGKLVSCFEQIVMKAPDQMTDSFAKQHICKDSFRYEFCKARVRNMEQSLRNKGKI